MYSRHDETGSYDLTDEPLTTAQLNGPIGFDVRPIYYELDYVGCVAAFAASAPSEFSHLDDVHYGDIHVATLDLIRHKVSPPIYPVPSGRNALSRSVSQLALAGPCGPLRAGSY